MIRKAARALGGDFKDKDFVEIVKSSAAIFTIRLVGLAAGYALIMLISRLYGSEVLGAHTISVTVLMMFTVLGRLGMDSFLVRNFAQDHAIGRWDRILELYRKTLIVIIPLGFALSVILFFTSSFIAEHIFKKPYLENYLKIISFGVLPMVLRFINSECYRGFRMNREHAYSQNVSYFLYASVLLGIFLAFSNNYCLPNAAFVISLMILAISSTILIMRRIRKNAETPSNEFVIPEIIKNSAPMMLANSMLLVSGWINTLMLGVFATETDVGIYSVVLKIASLTTFILMSINSIATPKFAQFYAAGNISGLGKYVSQTAKVIFYSSVPIFFIIVVLNKWLLGLFGEEFVIGSTALLITMAGQLFNVFAGSVGNILYMTGNQAIFRNIIIISTAINIIVCAILIPWLGLIGSAIAGMAFMATWNMLSVIYIKRKLGISSFYNPF